MSNAAAIHNTPEKILVERDNGRNLSFSGELIAKASSSDNRAMGSSWSGETGRWQVLRLYKTARGKYVAQRINRTRWQGDRDTSEAVICENEGQVIEFFGYGWLAKDLYYSAGIDASVDVDGGAL